MSIRQLISAAATFEAALRVGALPDGHRSRRLHGHSFFVAARAALAPGWAPFVGAEVGELRRCVEQAVAPLDYSLLNDTLPVPTDENLARFVAAALDAAGVPGLAQVSVHSTPHSGVDLDLRGNAHIWRRYRFQAAHRLPRVPPGHKCGRMHGHGFEVILHAKQDVSARDMGVDYDALDALWAPLHFQLNYRCLNDIAGLDNPTSEVIAAWLWQQLKPRLSELSWVSVYETGSCGANFDGRTYRIWKELSFDSAVRNGAAPQGSELARVHGHTYTLRLHLSAPLDEVMGWTVDYGDVKARFDPIFMSLDHRALYEIDGLAQGDAASIATQTLRLAQAVLPGVTRLDLFETRGCGAIVSTEQPEELIPL
jgi:6-pyruvoyltetrahydropterin/6-carboxytetrahydropterin synthase